MRGRVCSKLIYSSSQYCGGASYPVQGGEGGADGKAGRGKGEEMVDVDLFIIPFGGNTLCGPKTYSFNTSVGRYLCNRQSTFWNSLPHGGRGYTICITKLHWPGQLRLTWVAGVPGCPEVCLD